MHKEIAQGHWEGRGTIIVIIGLPQSRVNIGWRFVLDFNALADASVYVL